MTEETARAALVWAAGKLGGRWRAVDGSVHRSRAFGIREDVPRKRFRLEYGDDMYAVIFCHGDTWRQALDDYVTACRWPVGGKHFPEEIKADSAEELVLKMAVSGVSRISPAT